MAQVKLYEEETDNVLTNNSKLNSCLSSSYYLPSAATNIILNRMLFFKFFFPYVLKCCWIRIGSLAVKRTKLQPAELLVLSAS